MSEQKSQLLFIILSLTTVSFAKIGDFEYQPTNEDLQLLKATLAEATQESRQFLPPPPPTPPPTSEETYKKEFYLFSAPDDDFEDVHAAHKIASTLQKNVRVVFIRAPEHKALEHAALQLAKHASNDKTAIYVLNKQHDVGDLAQRLTAYREQYVQKPEVHFVKYRNAAEAEQAQQQIQSHYNMLHGSTHTSNEGEAPVLDFTTNKKEQPSYGSAISVLPGYNLGSGGSSSSSSISSISGSGVSSSSGSISGLYDPRLLSRPAEIKDYSAGSSSSSLRGGSDSPNILGPPLLSNPAKATGYNYNIGSSGGSSQSNDDLSSQQLLSSTEPNNFSQQPIQYEKPTPNLAPNLAANLAALRLLKTFKSQTHAHSFNSNSISSSNIGSFSSLGGGGGIGGGTPSPSYGVNAAVDDGNFGGGGAAGVESLGLSANSVDNGADLASTLEAYGIDPRNSGNKRRMQVETDVSKLNERQNTGSNFKFPTDGGVSKSHLPSFRRKLKQL